MGISVSFYMKNDVKSPRSEETGLSYSTMMRILNILGLDAESESINRDSFFSVDAFKFIQKAEKALCLNRRTCVAFGGGHCKDEDSKEVRFLRQMVDQYNQFRRETGKKPRKFGGA